jgi:rhamnosyltransferase
MSKEVKLGRRIGAVMVLYLPDHSIIQNMIAVAQQVDFFVVVDNGSDTTFWQELARLHPKLDFQHVSNPKNLGIATAFNIGAQILLEKGCDFVMTFDQDSRLPQNYVASLLEAYVQAKNKFGEIGVFGSYYQDTNSGFVFPNHISVKDSFVVLESTISSGNLIPAETFAQIGFFRDDFFIDAVDTEFHLRAKAAGLLLVLTRKLILPHQLGKQSVVSLFGFRIPITRYNHLRRYYWARNRILTYKLYARKYPSWFRLELRMFLGDFLTIIFFEKEKIHKLKSTLKGIFDGIQGKTGEIEL